MNISAQPKVPYTKLRHDGASAVRFERQAVEAEADEVKPEGLVRMRTTPKRKQQVMLLVWLSLESSPRQHTICYILV